MALNQECGVHVIKNATCDSNLTSAPLALGMPHEGGFEVAVELYLISLIGIIGLLGNLASVIVLRQDKERCETLLLLQVLAVCDACYVVIALLRYPLKYLISNPYNYHKMQLYVFPLLKTFQAITIWMMVLVTVDRYIYVCKPLRAQEIFNRRTRRTFAVLVVVFGVLFSLPRFLDRCIMSFSSCDKVTVSRVVHKPIFNNVYYYNVYRYGMFITFLYIIPLSLLFYMNVRLIVAIKKSKRRHREMRIHGYPSSSNPSYNSHTETNATTVLVIIILVFIICETPESILLILTTLQQNKVMTFISQPFYICNTISALLMVVNSSVNFFIYFVFGKRFRYILKETFIVKLQSSMTLFTRESVPLNRQNMYM